MSHKTKILLVDDNAAFLRTLTANLKSVGFETHATTNPLDALAAAREFMPDLIILDVVMPTQDGGDLYKTLRAQAEFRHTPIIFITGAVDTPTYNNGMIFLPKTLKFAQITAEIQKALAAKPRENSARDARPV